MPRIELVMPRLAPPPLLEFDDVFGIFAPEELNEAVVVFRLNREVDDLAVRCRCSRERIAASPRLGLGRPLGESIPRS